ncbi:MAG: hypothetical protein AB1512_27910 [Thermodesulfobacteriota bacterium]
MVDKQYRVVFLGLSQGMEDFTAGMLSLGVGIPMVEEMVRKAPVVLKAGMSLPQARRYAEAVQRAGGKVNIQDDGLAQVPSRNRRHTEIKPFEYFTMCPECGHKQPRGEACVKCGRSFTPQPCRPCRSRAPGL